MHKHEQKAPAADQERVAGVRGHPVAGGARQATQRSQTRGLPQHKRQRLAKRLSKIVYTSRFVRVILAQGHADLFCIVPILSDDPKGIQDAMK